MLYSDLVMRAIVFVQLGNFFCVAFFWQLVLLKRSDVSRRCRNMVARVHLCLRAGCHIDDCFEIGV